MNDGAEPVHLTMRSSVAIFMMVLAVLALGGAAVAQSPIASDAVATDEAPYTILETRPGQGETCLVCGRPVINEDVVELRFRGRVFHVGAPLLQDFLDDHNEDPKPFVWTRSADDILESVARFCGATLDAHREPAN